MKTYEIVWNYFHNQQFLDEAKVVRVNPAQMFTEVLENTPDCFVFILTKEQFEDPNWQDGYRRHKWNRFLHHDSEKYLWNPNYTKEAGYDPRLRVIILKGTGKEE